MGIDDEMMTGDEDNRQKNYGGDSCGYQILPFPTEPLVFGQAMRVPGFVSTRTTTTQGNLPPQQQNQDVKMDTDTVIDECSASNTATRISSLSGSTNPHSTTNTMPPPLPQQQRQQSIAGNILILYKPIKSSIAKEEDQHQMEEEGGLETYRAFLLQRKLEQTRKGNSSIRVGYPLRLVDWEKKDDETQDHGDHGGGNVIKGQTKGTQQVLRNRIWEVEPDASLVAIHVQTIRTKTCTKTLEKIEASDTSHLRLVHYNPHAEWFVWQHNGPTHTNSSILLGSELMGRSPTTTTTATNSTSFSRDEEADNVSIYYTITAWHPTSLWDELCTRQHKQQQSHGVTEDEARHVFLQILQCLERLQQMQLCHRNITLHNLLLVEDIVNDDGCDDPIADEEDDDDKNKNNSKNTATTTTDDYINQTASEAWTTTDKKEQQSQSPQRKHRDLTHQRICLARHGWAIRVAPKDSLSLNDAEKDTNKNSNKTNEQQETQSHVVVVIPTPITALPLYVAPEWMMAIATATSQREDELQPSKDGDGMTTKTLTVAAPTLPNPTASLDPFALDLWSASICLLVLLVGVADMDRLLFAVPVPEADPRFEQVTQHVESYFNETHAKMNWSPNLCHFLQSLLHVNPLERLTNLDKIRQHPWLLQEEEQQQPQKHDYRKGGVQRNEDQDDPKRRRRHH